MAISRYISIDSVLHDVSLILDDPHYNEHKMREWAIQGYRKLRVHDQYQVKVALLQVISHKVILPADLRHIAQIAYKTNVTTDQITELRRIMNIENEADNPALRYMVDPEGFATRILNTTLSGLGTPWKPMRRSTNSFIKTVGLDASIYGDDESTPNFNFTHKLNCPECEHEYTVDHNLCLTTTLADGFIWVSYLAHISDTKGRVLIPDDEDLKDALMHYCLYKYWLTKSSIKEEGAIRERDWHLSMYQTLKTKAAGNINMPDTDRMENIAQLTNRLVPRRHMYSGFFDKLNHRENITNDY